MSTRRNTTVYDGIKITSSKTVIDVLEVLVPGAIISTHQKRPLNSFGLTPFSLVCLQSHLRTFNPATFHLPLGIGTGNPGVFQGYPYPYPRKPAPVPKGTGMGTGSAKTRGYSTRARVCSKTDSETSQQQCKCQSTPPCSIARLAIWGWLAYPH